jgi:hypothetical protein
VTYPYTFHAMHTGRLLMSACRYSYIHTYCLIALHTVSAVRLLRYDTTGCSGIIQKVYMPFYWQEVRVTSCSLLADRFHWLKSNARGNPHPSASPYSAPVCIGALAYKGGRTPHQNCQLYKQLNSSNGFNLE